VPIGRTLRQLRSPLVIASDRYCSRCQFSGAMRTLLNGPPAGVKLRR